MLFNTSVLIAVLASLMVIEAAPMPNPNPIAVTIRKGKALGRRAVQVNGGSNAGKVIDLSGGSNSTQSNSNNSNSNKNNQNKNNNSNNSNNNNSNNNKNNNNKNNNNESNNSAAGSSQRNRVCDQGDQSLAAAFQANIVISLGQQASVLTLQDVLRKQGNKNKNNNNQNNNNNKNQGNNNNNKNEQNQNQNSNANKNASANDNANKNSTSVKRAAVVNSGSNNNGTANASQSNNNGNKNNNSSSNANESNNNNGKNNNSSSSNNKNNSNNNGNNNNNNKNNNNKFADADFQAGADRLNQFLQTSSLQLQVAQTIADDASLAQPQLSQLISALRDQQKLADSLTGDAARDGNTLKSLLDSFITSTGLSQDGANNALVDCNLPTTLVSA